MPGAQVYSVSYSHSKANFLFQGFVYLLSHGSLLSLVVSRNFYIISLTTALNFPEGVLSISSTVMHSIAKYDCFITDNRQRPTYADTLYTSINADKLICKLSLLIIKHNRLLKRLFQHFFIINSLLFSAINIWYLFCVLHF